MARANHVMSLLGEVTSWDGDVVFIDELHFYPDAPEVIGMW
jgi:Holliday junction resolvasome RuvABC ATP-dependent DNA helicase subunit